MVGGTIAAAIEGIEKMLKLLDQFPSDALLGDMVLDECFDERGALIWREVNEAYAEALPGYNKGDPRGCSAVVVGEQAP